MVKENLTKPGFSEDILGGIKAAIERGENLKEAMVTFYNSGYSKKEIENAARDYVMEKKGKEAQMKKPIVSSTISKDKIKESKASKLKSKLFSSKKDRKQKEIMEKASLTSQIPTLTDKEAKPSSEIKKPFQSDEKDSKVGEVSLGKNLLRKIVSRPASGSKGTKQIASKYSGLTKKKTFFEPVTIVLVLLLVLLIIILGAVFLFKEQLVGFFNGLFG